MRKAEGTLLQISPKKRKYLHRIVYVLSSILYMVWISSYLEKLYYFGDSSLIGSIMGYTSIPLCLILGLFILWVPFRSYLVSKLNLDPNRLIHCITVAWILYTILSYFRSVALSPPTPPHAHVPVSRDDLDFALQVISSLFQNAVQGIGALLLVGLGTYRTKKEVLVRLGFDKKPTWKDAFFSLCWIGFLIIFINITKFGIHQLWPGAIVLPKLTLGLWIIIKSVILAPIVEEIFYRGALQPRVGIWITSILFAVMHGSQGWFGVVAAFLVSVCLGWIARRYSIWLAIGAHMLCNLVMILLDNL